MKVEGKLLIGNSSARGLGGDISAFAAEEGHRLEPPFGGATQADLDRAIALAWSAYMAYRETKAHDRAKFLDAIGAEIASLGDELIVRAMTETGLPRGRLEGEQTRTINQLMMFAQELRSHDPADLRFDPEDPMRTPVPRPQLRSRRIGVGPVAVFGASNFPLAFSVAGGDTASALAAGCPVVVKAHSAHMGTADLVGQAVQRAALTCGMPDGTFSLIFASSRSIGERLVADDRIRAVGFTGSRQGGITLQTIAQARRRPIPVYAEMSSINPVILFPEVLRNRSSAIAKDFVQSLTLGAGQFCTNPGVVFAVDGPDLDNFVAAAQEHVRATSAQTMLTGGIARTYEVGTRRLSVRKDVNLLASGEAGSDRQAKAMLFETDGKAFLDRAELQEEMFGPAGIIVRCADLDQIEEIIRSIEGQLTVSLHADPADFTEARAMIPMLEDLGGRLLVNGFGTGIELSRAMVHGGPFPSTSDSRTTSVGTMALERFLRPVCYQNFPAELLPDALRAFTTTANAKDAAE
ncbi:MAG TPA: aldehyde dehydrogenase (NADP(+)) [Rhizobium sp.]